MAVLNAGQVGRRLGVSEQRVGVLLKRGRFAGARKVTKGRVTAWEIPEAAVAAFEATRGAVESKGESVKSKGESVEPVKEGERVEASAGAGLDPVTLGALEGVSVAKVGPLSPAPVGVDPVPARPKPRREESREESRPRLREEAQEESREERGAGGRGDQWPLVLGGVAVLGVLGVIAWQVVGARREAARAAQLAAAAPVDSGPRLIVGGDPFPGLGARVR